MAVEVERLITLLEARITGYERELRRSVQVANRSARRIESRFETMNRRITGSFNRLRGGLTALAGGLVGRSIIRAADQFQMIENRLTLLTGSTEEARREMARLFDVAQRTRSDFGATADVFARLAVVSQSTGLSMDQTRELVEGLNAGMINNGVAVQESANAIRQLGQAFASGRLAGDELRSVLENMGPIGQDVAEELGFKGATAIGQFREAARTGALSIAQIAAGMRNALLPQIQRLQNSVPTVGQSFVQFTNSLERATAEAFNGEGASAALTSSLSDLSDIVESEGFKTGLTVLAQGIGEIVKEATRGVKAIGDLANALRGGGFSAEDIFRNSFFGRASGLAADLLLPEAPATSVTVPLPPRSGSRIPVPGGGGTDEAATKRQQALEKYIQGLEREAQVSSTAEAHQKLHNALLDAQAKLLDENGKLTRELTMAEKQRISAAVRGQDRDAFMASLAELNEQVGGLERLAEAYAISEQAGRAMESQIAAEAEARKNAEVDVDALTAALERERKAREGVDTARTLAGIQTQTSALLAEAEAVGQTTIRWNEATRTFEAYNRQALIVAETQRLLVADTNLSAGAARAAAEAHVDATERLAQAQANTNARVQDLNEYTGAAQSALTGFFGDMARGESAVASLGRALQNLSQQLLQLALNQLFLQLLGAAAGGATGAASGGAGGGSGAQGQFLISHHGGRVGGVGSSRRVHPGVFAGAKRYHSGGLVGDEVPAILQRGEIVIPRARARQMQAAQSQTPNVNVPVSVVNTFDEVDVVSAAFGRPAGEQVFVNAVRRNATAIRGALGIADNRVRG